MVLQLARCLWAYGHLAQKCSKCCIPVAPVVPVAPVNFVGHGERNGSPCVSGQGRTDTPPASGDPSLDSINVGGKPLSRSVLWRQRWQSVGPGASVTALPFYQEVALQAAAGVPGQPISPASGPGCNRHAGARVRPAWCQSALRSGSRPRHIPCQATAHRAG